MRFPAEPALIGTARLFASSVAAHEGCSADRREDVKLAVSEACTLLIEAGAGPAIELEATPRDGEVGFALRAAGIERLPERTWDDAGVAPPSGLDMIRLLFDDVALEPVRDVVTIRFAAESGPVADRPGD
jgi:anti-sigma regulatory factor (Ser/Thr protein kinase)